jgi:hypothetical protein
MSLGLASFSSQWIFWGEGQGNEENAAVEGSTRQWVKAEGW